MISVVLPTFNGSRYVREAIASVLAQTHQALELIVVDDGSTDDTPSILASYADSRMRVIRHPQNAGLPTALNTGFASAIGDFVTWTSDDNYYVPEALEVMAAHALASQSDCVYTDYFECAPGGPPRLVSLPPRFDPKSGVTLGACFLYARAVMTEVGAYDPDTVPAEDYDYWLRIAARYSIAHINQPLYYYRLHPQSLTAQTAASYAPRIMNILLRLRYGHLSASQARTGLLLMLATRRLERRPIAVLIHRASSGWLWRRLVRLCSLARRPHDGPLVDSILAQFLDGGASCQQTLAAIQSLAPEAPASSQVPPSQPGS